MIPEQREQFNATFSERRFQLFLERLNERTRTDISFRVSETPFFVPKEIQCQCEEAAIDLTLQAHDPEYLRRSDGTLKPEYTVPNQPDRSLFMSVDFAIAQDADGNIVPKLIELQGFPSLMGYQLLMAELLQEHFQLDPALRYINGGYTRSEYLDVLHRAIVGEEDPEQVVLMELDPWSQKTMPDFRALKELLGIAVVDIRHVEKDGKILSYRTEKGLVPIRRVFNRSIIDEINREGVELPFDWRDELDVQWAGHPNWYFRISKFTLPYLDHQTIPSATFLSDLEEIPGDLSNYVLKPLYSFAGAGVIISPTPDDIRGVPQEQRSGFLLQEKIEYAGAIVTPEGGTKAEMRVMLIWLPEEERPRPVMGLVRMGRGMKMGVDQNRELGWIGASCNFFEP